MIKNDKKECLMPDGSYSNPAYLPTDAKADDRTVEQIFRIVNDVNYRLQQAHKKIDKILSSHMTKFAARYDEEWKGNFTLKDLANTLKIEANISEQIEFNNHIELAHQKFAQFFNETFAKIEKGSDAHASIQKIKEIVNRAFKLKGGKLNKGRIIELLQYDFKNKTWLEGREHLVQGMKIVGSKQYLNFLMKTARDTAGKFQRVVLNYSALD